MVFCELNASFAVIPWPGTGRFPGLYASYRRRVAGLLGKPELRRKGLDKPCLPFNHGMEAIQGFQVSIPISQSCLNRIGSYRQGFVGGYGLDVTDQQRRIGMIEPACG